MKRRRSERGFTLIELMIALIVSSLLVGMILAIFSRMSVAYRGQQQIAGVQQVLAGARAMIAADAKHAGYMLPQGFKTQALPNDTMPPIAVYDNPNNINSDEIAFYYADSTKQGLVTSIPGWGLGTPTVTYSGVGGFVVGDLVILSTMTGMTGTGPLNINGGSGNGTNTDAGYATYSACMMKVSAIGANSLTFSTVNPWGTVGGTHCASPPTPNQTMVYGFIARAYRINPTPANASLGILEMSPTGDLTPLVNDWTPQAYGFTDIQAAVQMYETNNGDSDADLDANRNWYSDALMITRIRSMFDSNHQPTINAPLQISISLVARTDRTIEGVSTTLTPQLIDPAKPGANTIGNHAQVDLTTTADPMLTGSRIYRYVTFYVDFRNLGVGR